MTTETPQAPAAPNAVELQPDATAAAPVDGAASPAPEAATADAPASEPDAEAAEKAKKNRERFDRRFSQLSQEAREAREEAAYYRGLAEAMQRLGQNAPPPPSPEVQASPAEADPPPNPETFPGGKYDPDYLDARADWAGRKAAREALEANKESARQAQEADAQAQAFEAGRKRFHEARADVDAFARENADYEGLAGALDTIARAEQPGTPGRLIDIVTKSENRAWVTAALATRPQLYQQIMGLDPMDRVAAIAKIDAQISANLRASASSAPAPQPPASNAAAPASAQAPSSPTLAPPATLNGRSATPVFDPEKATMAEYAAWRNSQPN